MEGSKKDIRYFACGVILLTVILVVWEVAIRKGMISTLAIPLPSKVFAVMGDVITSPAFLKNWGRTLIIWAISLTCGLFAGLLLGFVAGAYRSVYLAMLPLVGYLRSIPPIAMFPIALVAIGPGGLSIGIVAAVGAALYVFPGTVEAARESAERFHHLAAILGARKGQFLRVFVAPGAALHALASSRIAATYAFAVCVAGDMIIGGRTGVGAAILDLSERYRLEEAYAYIVLTGVVGLLIDLALQRVSRIRIRTGEPPRG